MRYLKLIVLLSIAYPLHAQGYKEQAQQLVHKGYTKIRTVLQSHPIVVSASCCTVLLGMFLFKKRCVKQKERTALAANLVQYNSGLKHIISGDVNGLTAWLHDNPRHVNITDPFGKTLLVEAVEKRDRAIVQVLLEAGADITIKDNDGNTTLDYAVEGSDIMQLLKAHESKKDPHITT